MGRKRNSFRVPSVTPRQSGAVRTISRVVIAFGVVALLRHYKREASLSHSAVAERTEEFSKHQDFNSSPILDESEPKRRILHNVVDVLLLAMGFLIVWRFRSASSPVKLAILASWVLIYGGWSLWARHWTNRTELLRRVGYLLLFGALAALIVLRVTSTEDLQERALLVFVVIAAAGFRLWQSEMSLASSRAGLGAALLGGVLVASTIYYVEQASEQRSQQHQLRFTVGLQKDLSAADLVDENLSNAHLYKKNFQDADLRGANLTGAFLVQTNLTGAWLSDALLTDSDLDGAVLKEAQLAGATLDGAYIADTNFQDSNLSYAKLRGLNTDEVPRITFQEATLVNVELSDANLAASNFRGADLTKASLANVELTEANLREANLADADLSEVQLDHSNLVGADLKTANLQEVNMAEAVADSETSWPQGFDPSSASVYIVRRHADLRKANLTGQDLSELDLTGTNFQRTHLEGADLTSAELAGADLRNATLDGAELSGSILTGANLRGANLNGMDLSYTDFTQADLQGSSLFAADLRKAILTKAQLNGAKATRETRWPRGFDFLRAGVRIVKLPENGD
jgi:uncharacterized protein YjbI with pentapeptide repeats